MRKKRNLWNIQTEISCFRCTMTRRSCRGYRRGARFLWDSDWSMGVFVSEIRERTDCFRNKSYIRPLITEDCSHVTFFSHFHRKHRLRRRKRVIRLLSFYLFSQIIVPAAVMNTTDAIESCLNNFIFGTTVIDRLFRQAFVQASKSFERNYCTDVRFAIGWTGYGVCGGCLNRVRERENILTRAFANEIKELDWKVHRKEERWKIR